MLRFINIHDATVQSEMKPRMAIQHLPGLPAFIIFMCIRYTDYMNDDEKVRSLLTGTINGIKKTVKVGGGHSATANHFDD